MFVADLATAIFPEQEVLNYKWHADEAVASGS
jgi:hypothetical protein